MALNWSVVEPKRRWVLICALQGSTGNPSHVFLVQRTTQQSAMRTFKPPRRLSVVDPDDGRTIHYVFAAGRFRRLGVNRMRRFMVPAPTKDLPAEHWQSVKEGVEAAPPRWQPVREAWASGGCPKPDSS